MPIKPASYTFSLPDIRGHLMLDAPISDDMGAYRTGRIALDSGRSLSLVCRHSTAAAALTYLHQIQIDDDWRRLVGLPDQTGSQTMPAPAQFVLGNERARLLSRGIRDMLSTTDLNNALKQTASEQIAAIPILREGAHLGLSDGLRTACGYALEELPIAARRAESSAQIALSFQDQILTDAHRERMVLALVGGNISDGQTHIAILNFLHRRFPRLTHIELMAPQASLQGMARLLALAGPGLTLRAHLFETPLDGDAHFPHPEFHIRPDLASAYRAWWGRDPMGFPIATMPCAGTDGSIPLFDPLRQIRTLNALLKERHRTTLSHVFTRYLAQITPIRPPVMKP